MISTITKTISLQVWQEVTSHTPGTAELLASLVFVLASSMQLQLPYPWTVDIIQQRENLKVFTIQRKTTQKAENKQFLACFVLKLVQN